MLPRRSPEEEGLRGVRGCATHDLGMHHSARSLQSMHTAALLKSVHISIEKMHWIRIINHVRCTHKFYITDHAVTADERNKYLPKLVTS